MFNKKTIKDVPISGKTILVRTDYNVPLDGDAIGDLRIKASLPTIEYLRNNGASKIILMSHLGRPDGKHVPELSLAPIAKRLQDLLPDVPVKFIPETTGEKVSQAVQDLPEGGILLLENLRFSPEEEANSEAFAKDIVTSTHADLFVQDGFAVVHRAHASTDAITRLLPSVAGLLLEREATELTSAVASPAHPLLVIVGGAKVADKQPMIDNFLGLADNIAVGGKIAADGYTSQNPNVYVATDFIEDSNGAKLDIGVSSTAKILEFIENAKTIIWNGVTGKSEEPAYAKSSTAIAEALGSHPDKKTIIGGGDTAEFVENLMSTHPGLTYSLISIGGGASLELLSGKTLPGIAALEDKL